MDPSLLEEIFPIFFEEAREHLAELSAGVLALERGGAGAGEVLGGILRAAHSLKGSASSLGFWEIEKQAHTLESALLGHPHGVPLQPQVVGSLLRAVTLLEEALRIAEAQGRPSPRAAPDEAARIEAPSAAEDGLWPVLRADVIAALEGLAAEPGASRMHLEAILGTARTLGLGALEALASVALDAPSPLDAASQRLLLDPLWAEVAALDARGEQQPLPAAASPLQGLVEAAEMLVSALIDPSEAARTEAAEGLVRIADELAAVATTGGDSRLLGLATALRLQTASAGEAGPDTPQAISALTGTIIELQQTLPVDSAPALAPAAAEPTSAVGPTTGAAEPTPAHASRERMVRVSSERLDQLAAQVEALSQGRHRQRHWTDEVAGAGGTLADAARAFEQVTADLRAAGLESAVHALSEAARRVKQSARSLEQMARSARRELESQEIVALQVRDSLRELRTVPASVLFEPLQRGAREVALRTGKLTTFRAVGVELRVDRRMVDLLREPLLHLVRNAVDHGLEPPATRARLGKPEEGVVEVRVEPRGHLLAFSVSDDGAGLDPQKLRAHAVARGLLSAAQAQELDDTEARRLVFRPGFSTAQQLTEISGRGVGLDVVEQTARELQGAVELESTPGRGTRFTVEVPQTLGAMTVVVVSVGGARAAIPYDRVERLLLLRPHQLSELAGRPVAQVESEQLPLIRLAEVFGLPGRVSSAEALPALVVTAQGARAVLGVDEVICQQEVIVHALGRAVTAAPHLAGAALLDDGSLVPVLSAPELLRGGRPATTGSAARNRILVVDDSLATRSAVRAMLELAGHDTAFAENGQEALEVLERVACDAVVTDVEMPRLDGLELTRRMRAHPRLRLLPVVVVTARDDPAERHAGMAAGADAYLLKREVQGGKLLETLAGLLAVRR